MTFEFVRKTVDETWLMVYDFIVEENVKACV